MNKILKIIVNVFISILIIILLFLLLVGAFNKKGSFKMFGFAFLYVDGNSMYPRIKNGDLISVKTTNDNSYEIGDVITFTTSDNSYMTHEIVEIQEYDNEYRYYTKGINNENRDNDYVTGEYILGKYNGFRIPLVGYFAKFVNTGLGYTLFVIVPVACLFGISSYELFKNVRKKKEEV